jgi:dienelactone hydrolase
MKKLIMLSALALWLGYVCAQMCAAQAALGGVWTGGLDSGTGWLSIEIRFENEKDDVRGSIDVPQFGQMNQPLSQIKVEGSRIHFEWKRDVGTGIFDGEFKDGGLVGNYQRGEVRSTFKLARIVKLPIETHEKYAGAYQMSADRFVHIGPQDESKSWFADTKTNRTGALYPTSETAFFVGSTTIIPLPVEAKIEFVKNRQGAVTGLKWSEGGRTVFAKRIPHKREELTFKNGDTTLTGVLISPVSKGRHPAIAIATPGYSLFPRPSNFPYFWVTQGFAYLQLTQRTVGGKPANYNQSSFEERARDVLAGVKYLKERADINPRQIGVHGSSLGAWVAPLTSTLSSDVAFLVLRVGSALPVHENILYEVENDLREQKFSEDEISRTVALRRLLNTTILTGSGWETLKAEIEKSRNERWFGYARVGWFSSVAIPPDSPTLKGLQDPINYNPVPVLERVKVPVLAINGELDKSVNTKVSVPIMEQAFQKAGNKDFTIIVLPKASHDLMEAETGYNSEWARQKRQSPDYWNIMAAWLKKRVTVKN